MKMKRQFLNLRFGNKKSGKKGFIFALDAAIAIVVTIIFLTASHHYIVKSEENILSNLQLERVGTDVITIFDNKNLLPFIDEERLDEDLDNELKNLLPSIYGMKVEVDYKCDCNNDILESACRTLKQNRICEDLFLIGDEIPNDAFVASSSRFFVKTMTIELDGEVYPNTFYYGNIRFWIWLK